MNYLQGDYKGKVFYFSFNWITAMAIFRITLCTARDPIAKPSHPCRHCVLCLQWTVTAKNKRSGGEHIIQFIAWLKKKKEQTHFSLTLVTGGKQISDMVYRLRKIRFIPKKKIIRKTHKSMLGKYFQAPQCVALCCVETVLCCSYLAVKGSWRIVGSSTHSEQGFSCVVEGVGSVWAVLYVHKK